MLMRRVLQQGTPCTTAALWLGYFHLSMQNTTFLSFDCRVLEFLSFNYRIPHVYFLQIANELSVIIFFPSIATFVCILSGLRKIKTLQETYKKKTGSMFFCDQVLWTKSRNISNNLSLVSFRQNLALKIGMFYQRF